MRRLSKSFHGIVRYASDCALTWMASNRPPPPMITSTSTSPPVLPEMIKTKKNHDRDDPFQYFQQFYKRHRHRIHVFPLSPLSVEKCLCHANMTTTEDELSMDYFFFDLETSSYDTLHGSPVTTKAEHIPCHSPRYVIGCFVQGWADIFILQIPSFSTCCSKPDAIYRIRTFRPSDLQMPVSLSKLNPFETHPMVDWMSCVDIALKDEESLKILCHHLSYMLCMWQFVDHHPTADTLMILPKHLCSGQSSPNSDMVTTLQTCLEMFMKSDYDVGYVSKSLYNKREQPVEIGCQVTFPYSQPRLPLFYKHRFLQQVFPKLWLCQSAEQCRSILGSCEDMRACVYVKA